MTKDQRPELSPRPMDSRAEGSADAITNVTSRQDGVDSRRNSNTSPNPNLIGPPYAFPFPFPVRGDSASNASTSVSTNSNSVHDSPLRRAGLLQPKSYVPPSLPNFPHSSVHTEEDIRSNTMQLSNMLLSPPTEAGMNFEGAGMDSRRPSTTSAISWGASPPKDGRVTDHDSPFEGSPSRAPPPSNLSILLARKSSPQSYSPPSSNQTPTNERPPPQNLPVTPAAPIIPSHVSQSFHSASYQSRAAVFDGLLSPSPPEGEIHRVSVVKSGGGERPGLGERVALLGEGAQVGVRSYTNPNPSPPAPSPSPPAGLPTPPSVSWKLRLQHKSQAVKKHLTKDRVKDYARGFARDSTRAVPAVVLGALLNILDGVSYGMIIFPASGVFEGLGGMGVSMFFVSAVIAQLVYTFGGSGFAGANGSMMIEVVPFFHIIASTIAAEIGEDKPVEIISTTLVAFALSSVLTGLTFFLLGALRLGALIGFFPRHILVGCIGGVGAFLIETGLTVSTRIPDDDFAYNFATLKFFFQPQNLVLWVPALGLAVLLRVITHKFHHQLIFPIYFLVIPIIFYIVVAAAQLNLGQLRQSGWLFDMGNAEDEHWYEFYSYYSDFGNVKLGALWATLPTQFALLFFNILHPPLNVPALAVSLNEDIDTNKELVAHGYSNLLAGVLGTVPNYLVYVNTLLFYRVGGGNRIAGFLLAVVTFVLLIIGTGPIAYLPVMVVGALIFVLGIDLVKEALWDTRNRVSRSEYLTIASIVVVMTVWDFVIGVLFGIVVSCFFFVVQNSQRRSIRAIHTGETAMSTVRRPSAHRAYIREVSRQTTILRLQGFLFFGTITHVEETIRDLVDDPSWQKTPVRFLVVDLTFVAGVDMSSAEAFVRVQRLLAAKSVVLVFCGFTAESAIGKALQSVGVLGEDFVELFTSFNDAMEWTENAYLRAWFRSQKSETTAVALPGRQDTDIGFHQSFANSPRRSQLRDVGDRTIGNDPSTFTESNEPYNTIIKVFSSSENIGRERLRLLVPYLERCAVPEGIVLWKQNQNADGLYLIESGVLRASYKFAEHTPTVEESMVPGTLAGELSALAGLPRDSTVVVERQAVIWKLSVENLQRLQTEDPTLATTFMKIVMKAAKIDYDILLSALATRQ